MYRPAFLRTSEQRITATVLTVLLWAPAWMIPARIIGTPWAMIGAAAITGAPLLIGAGWLFWIVWRQADPVQRLLIVLFFVFVIGVASAVPNWAQSQDPY
jgi:hypothetical protein